MLFIVLLYIGAGTLFLLLYAWHEYTEGGKLITRMAKSPVHGAKEETK